MVWKGLSMQALGFLIPMGEQQHSKDNSDKCVFLRPCCSVVPNLIGPG